MQAFNIMNDKLPKFKNPIPPPPRKKRKVYTAIDFSNKKEDISVLSLIFDTGMIPIEVKADDNGHVYIIPLTLSSEFDELYNIKDDDYDAQSEWENKFSMYMVGGCVSSAPTIYVNEDDFKSFLNKE